MTLALVVHCRNRCGRSTGYTGAQPHELIVGAVAAAHARDRVPLAGSTLRVNFVRRATRFGAPACALRELHSGIIADFVTLVMVGTAVLATATAIRLRSY